MIRTRYKGLLRLLICAVSIMAVLMMSVPATAAGTDKNVTVTKGHSVTLTVKGAEGDVSWSTSDKSVAAVKNGKVTAKKAGKAVITAKADSMAQKYNVTVVNGKLKPSTKKVELVRGKSQTIKLTAIGSHGVKLSSSDKNVATASWVKPWDGDSIGIKINAKRTGTAKIKVSMTKYPDVYTVITVKVTAKPGTQTAAAPVSAAPDNAGHVSYVSRTDTSSPTAEPEEDGYDEMHHVGETLGASDEPVEQGEPPVNEDTIENDVIELPMVVIK
ncbi:MAG: hypothetical protein IJ251_08760 [Oscillospiraceae bacterium]|nr:hypothetical protein [Oscillospiraceae bacterium]